VSCLVVWLFSCLVDSQIANEFYKQLSNQTTKQQDNFYIFLFIDILFQPAKKTIFFAFFFCL